MKVVKGKIVFENDDDLLPVAMSLQTTNWNQTGSWKYLEPYYQDLTPPCVGICRVGNDIVTFMRLVEERRFDKAAMGLLEHNPFPAILGRVCPHPCETSCSRKNMGGSISIQAAERWLGDLALEHGFLPTMAEERKQAVTIIGSGPAGLSAAYFLRKLGHPTHVIEAEDRPGGLLWSGIPPFRLPRAVLEAEIQRLITLGVTFEFGKRLGANLSIEEARKQGSVLLLALGLGQSRKLGIQEEDHPQVIQGIRLLRELHEGKKPSLGKIVAVIGGGNTAIDCARSLLRLGHCVTVVYRRTSKEMPAFAEEFLEAIEENVEFEFLAAPVGLQRVGDQILAVRCIRMKLGPPDESGRRTPIPIPNSEFLVPAESVVVATGEVLEDSILPQSLASDGRMLVNVYRTNMDGVFACGDSLGNGGTVADAVRSGREAAYAIHGDLTGEAYHSPDLLSERNASDEIANVEAFNLNYFRNQAGPSSKMLSVDERFGNFDEIRKGLSEIELLSEAKRCFKCGTCNSCGNCSLFCPDGAILKDGSNGKYHVLHEYCKGCLVCVEECPRAAIHARKVEV